MNDLTSELYDKIDRLENVIKELRSWLEEQIKHEYKGSITYEVYYKMLSKLNELEGNSE